MTREEAINHLKDILAEATETERAVCYVTNEDAEALEMAIETLKEQRPLLEISKTVNREEFKNIIKNCPMMLITPDTEKIELIREQQWIPCSERLPDKKGKYLCTVHYAVPPYHMFHPELDTYVDEISIQEFKEAEDGNVAFIDSVVSWMPLPSPYKEKQK